MQRPEEHIVYVLRGFEHSVLSALKIVLIESNKLLFTPD